MLHDFGEDLSLQDKYKVREIQQNATKFEKKTHSGQSSIAFQLLDMVAIPKKIFFKVNELTTPYKNEFCSNYLKLRKIDITKWKYFAFNENTKELFILNINSQETRCNWLDIAKGMTIMLMVIGHSSIPHYSSHT